MTDRAALSQRLEEITAELNRQRKEVLATLGMRRWELKDDRLVRHGVRADRNPINLVAFVMDASCGEWMAAHDPASALARIQYDLEVAQALEMVLDLMLIAGVPPGAEESALVGLLHGVVASFAKAVGLK